MDRTQILKLLKDEKVQNYTYIIAFFVIFAVFVLFVITPNLSTAFSLQKELQDIKLKNQEYEAQIQQIVDYQTKVEQYRDQFYLLSEAIPDKPSVAKVVDDVVKSASASGMILSELGVDPIDIKSEKPDNKLKSFSVNLSTTSSNSQLQLFFEALINQRRIKTIDSIQLTGSGAEDQADNYSINLIITGHYL